MSAGMKERIAAAEVEQLIDISYEIDKRVAAKHREIEQRAEAERLAAVAEVAAYREQIMQAVTGGVEGFGPVLEERELGELYEIVNERQPDLDADEDEDSIDEGRPGRASRARR